MKKKKLTGKDTGKLANTDQRCTKNKKPKKFVKDQVE